MSQDIVHRSYRSRDGLMLAADVGGPADAPIVALMHGGGQTRHSWAGAMRALIERGYRVINFDGRGHGDSGWSEAGAYELDDRVDDLSAVLQGARQYALVGASLGGATALVAMARGLKPAAAVLVDIVPHAEPAGISRIVNFMQSGVDGFASLDEAIEAVAAYNPSHAPPRDPSGLMRNLRARDDGRLRWHWDPRILADPSKHHTKVQAATERLARNVAPPVLLVRGLQSDVVSDAGVAKFRQLLPTLEVVDVAGAGHMVAGDRNDAFNAGVIAFLGRHMPVGA
jgi:pimeloyl-ACP methyl ester carboxylesterase